VSLTSLFLTHLSSRSLFCLVPLLFAATRPLPSPPPLFPHLAFCTGDGSAVTVGPPHSCRSRLFFSLQEGRLLVSTFCFPHNVFLLARQNMVGRRSPLPPTRSVYTSTPGPDPFQANLISWPVLAVPCLAVSRTFRSFQSQPLPLGISVPQGRRAPPFLSLTYANPFPFSLASFGLPIFFFFSALLFFFPSRTPRVHPSVVL